MESKIYVIPPCFEKFCIKFQQGVTIYNYFLSLFFFISSNLACCCLLSCSCAVLVAVDVRRWPRPKVPGWCAGGGGGGGEGFCEVLLLVVGPVVVVVVGKNPIDDEESPSFETTTRRLPPFSLLRRKVFITLKCQQCRTKTNIIKVLTV